MQPLGAPDLLAAYHERIAGSHDYVITAEVLDMDENVIGPAVLVDGQIDILRSTSVRRTARATLSDPDRALGLDSDSVFTGSAAANRMLRIRHTVEVPGYGDVTCTPFVGPFVRVNRNGATIDIEAHEKTYLAVTGTRPFTVPKGMNAMTAVRAIMAERTGETKFRLPSGVRFKLRRPYSVSWPDESSPWVRVQQISHAAGMTALYSCDGYMTVRPYATAPVLEFGGTAGASIRVTGAPAADADFSQIVNYSRVEADKIIVVRDQDAIDSTHPFSPTSLARNGVKRYLPSLTELSGPGSAPTRPGTKHRPASKAEWTKYSLEVEKFNAATRSATSKAIATAEARLEEGLTQQVNLNFAAVPVFHLDYGDPIRVTTAEGSQVVRFTQASIPLVSGDMTVGVLRQVSRVGRNRG